MLLCRFLIFYSSYRRRNIPSVMVQWSNHTRKKERNELLCIFEEPATNNWRTRFKVITNKQQEPVLFFVRCFGIPSFLLSLSLSPCLSPFLISIWPFFAAALHHRLAAPWNSLSWAVLSLFTQFYISRLKDWLEDFFLNRFASYVRFFFVFHTNLQILTVLSMLFPSHVLGALKLRSRFELWYLKVPENLSPSVAFILTRNVEMQKLLVVHGIEVLVKCLLRI